MVTTRSKARLLEQTTNDRGSNERTEGAQDTPLLNQRPVGAVIYRGTVRGAADNNAPSHGKDTESNGALIPYTFEENESTLTESDSTDASKAKHTTNDDSHARDLSVPPATLETNAPDEPEVLSDATNKASAKTNVNTGNGGTKPRGKRGRRPTRYRNKNPLSVAEKRTKHSEVVQDVERADTGSTPVGVHRPLEAATLSDQLPSTSHGSEETLTTLPSTALSGHKGKGKAVDSVESSANGSSDRKADAADALLQLWTFRSSAQCSGNRSSTTDEAAGSSVQPRRSYRLEKKKEERERKEKEQQEKKRQEMERQKNERQKEEEKTKRARNTSNEADDTRTKKGKATGVPAPRAAAKATKRKREVVDVEDVEDVEAAVEDSGAKRKRTASRPAEQARNETEHPTHDRCSPSTCSVSTLASTDAFQSSDASEALNASETINTSGTTNASRIIENFAPFDVKKRIRDYMQVSSARSTLQESEFEDPLDEDNAPSSVPIFRRIIPPPPRLGFPSQPYYLTRLLSVQLGNIGGPEAWRQ